MFKATDNVYIIVQLSAALPYGGKAYLEEVN